MDRYEMYLKIARCFPESFMNYRGEVIVHKYSNTYFILQNCENELEVQCKILEWLSRAAYKTEPYRSEKKNNEFHWYILNGINRFLGTEFTEDDMDDIYTYIGNACNHEKTKRFILSGYNMRELHREG